MTYRQNIEQAASVLTVEALNSLAVESSRDEFLRTVPKTRGLYFVMRPTVVYVGRSRNLRQRITQHRKDSRFQGAVIAWRVLDGYTELAIRLFEAFCIQRFKPLLNKDYNGKSVSRWPFCATDEQLKA